MTHKLFSVPSGQEALLAAVIFSAAKANRSLPEARCPHVGGGVRVQQACGREALEGVWLAEGPLFGVLFSHPGLVSGDHPC
ncbi:MAG: hypothetical protein KAT11_03160, partial [Phycisphaerae bacterium]|nr:hypothetical protein [Phycisphaerae bacterium]